MGDEMKRRLGRLFAVSWFDQDTEKSYFERWDENETDSWIDTTLFVVCLTLIGLLFVSVLVIWQSQ
jgi:hypothetical protein